MDVCNPPLVWVGGSCYRKNPYMESTSDTDRVYSDTQDQYADEMYPADDVKEFEDGIFTLTYANTYTLNVSPWTLRGAEGPCREYRNPQI